MLFAPDTVPFIASLTAVLLSATVGLVLRFRNGAKPARRANLFKEEGTPAAPDAAEDEEHDVLLADEPEGGSCTTKPEQRGDYPLLGSRVEFHGLQKAAPLNGTYGVVLRESAGRFAVRKEVAHADDAASVMVRAYNLRAAPPLDSLAAVQRLVDAAPTGARVTLPCGEVMLRAPLRAAEPAAEPCRAIGIESDAGAADQAAAEEAAEAAEAEGGTLLLSRAITLAGMGCRSGGTVLHFGVTVGPEVQGPVWHSSSRWHVRPWRAHHLCAPGQGAYT